MALSITIDRATELDVQAILTLLESRGLPRAGFLDHLATALAARHDGRVVGSAALELYPGGALLRSVAIARELQGLGLGKRLTEAAIALARTSGAPAMYLLTTTAEHFFPQFGFVRIARDDVPADVAQSVEFISACPASAVVMRKELAIAMC